MVWRLTKGAARRRRERESFYRYGTIPDWWRQYG